MVVVPEEARARARAILEDVFADELLELARIEEDRERAVARSENLQRELQDAERVVASVRDALEALPDRMGRLQLESDHIGMSELQDTYQRLRRELEASESRLRAARDARDRGSKP